MSSPARLELIKNTPVESERQAVLLTMVADGNAKEPRRVVHTTIRHFDDPGVLNTVEILN